MRRKVRRLRQPTLFETERTWNEFPAMVRDEVIQLLATMSMEITNKSTTDNEEQQHEPAED